MSFAKDGEGIAGAQVSRRAGPAGDHSRIARTALLGYPWARCIKHPENHRRRLGAWTV